MNGKRISSHIAEIVLRVIGSITLVTSLMMVTGAIISYGFPLAPDQNEGMEMFFRYVWAVFILDRVLLIILEPHHLKTGIRGVSIGTDILLLLTVLPPALPSLGFLGSSVFRDGVLLLLSVLELSKYLTHLLRVFIYVPKEVIGA